MRGQLRAVGGTPWQCSSWLSPEVTFRLGWEHNTNLSSSPSPESLGQSTVPWAILAGDSGGGKTRFLRGTLGAAPLCLMAVWVWDLSSWLISNHLIWNSHSSQDSFSNGDHSALLWDKYLIRMRVKTLFCPRTPRQPFTPMKSPKGSLMPMQKRQESEF